MEKEYITLECYRIFTEAKERFIDRSFNTNKFYLGIEIFLAMVICLAAGPAQNPPAIAFCSIIGMLVAALWWFNQDSYEYLIKIKYKEVLEKLENEMGVKPVTMEYEAKLAEAKKKKGYIYNNTHKFFSFLFFLTFLIFFMNSAVTLFEIMFSTGTM